MTLEKWVTYGKYSGFLFSVKTKELDDIIPCGEGMSLYIEPVLIIGDGIGGHGFMIDGMCVEEAKNGTECCLIEAMTSTAFLARLIVKSVQLPWSHSTGARRSDTHGVKGTRHPGLHDKTGDQIVSVKQEEIRFQCSHVLEFLFVTEPAKHSLIRVAGEVHGQVASSNADFSCQLD